MIFILDEAAATYWVTSARVIVTLTDTERLTWLFFLLMVQYIWHLFAGT